MTSHAAVFLGTFLFLFFSVPSATAQSFDCGKASTAAELAICADRSLAELDVEMARLYAQSRKAADTAAAADLVARQRVWLKRRAKCGSDVDCLVSQFRERIAELQSASPAAIEEAASIDCSQALADARSLSSLVHFTADLPPKVIPFTRIELSYVGAHRSPIPVYIVIDLPAESRLSGRGFLSLTSNARGPNGLMFAVDRVRAIVPLNVNAPKDRGSIGTFLLMAGTHELGLSLVTGGGCGEHVLQNQRISVKVELGPPELVVQEASSALQPRSVVPDVSGTLNLSVFEGRYEVSDRATGSLILSRPGLMPRFSPTGRFVVSVRADDGEFEVIDIVGNSVIGRFPTGVVAWARNDSFIVAGGTSRTSRNITMSSLNADMRFETSMTEQQAAWWDDEMFLDIDRMFFAATTVEGGALWDLVSGERVIEPDPDRTSALRRVVKQQRGLSVPTVGPRWRLGEPILITHDDWLEYGNSTSAPPQDFTLVAGEREDEPSAPVATSRSDGVLCEERPGRGLARAKGQNALCAYEIAGRGLQRLPEQFTQTPEDIIFARIGGHIGPLVGGRPTSVDRFGGWWDEGSESRAMLDKLVAELRNISPQFEAGISLLTKDDMTGFGNCRTALQAFDPRHLVRSWQWESPRGNQAVGYLECHMGSAWQRYANLFLISKDGVQNLSLALMSEEERKFASEDDPTAQPVFGSSEQDGSDVQTFVLGDELIYVSVGQSGRTAVIDSRTGTRVGALLPASDATLVRAVRLTQDGRHLVQLNNDGRFFVFRISDGAQVLIGAHVDDEIVVMTPDGRFDTSYEGAHALHVRFSGVRSIQTVHQFRAALYRPGLAQAVLGGGEVAQRPDELGTPPVIEFSLGAVLEGRRMLTIQATDDSMVAMVRVMVDGKLIAAYPFERASIRHTVQIQDPGGGRWVTAVAIDEDGLASSTKAILLSPPLARRGVLRAVLVGIDTYRADAGIPPLQFARSDAQRLKTALLVSGQSYDQSDDAVVLLDDAASRMSIISAVRKAVADMGPDDTLVFSFAGHAVGSGGDGSSGDLLLVLPETRIDDLSQTALSWREVAAELTQAKGKVLVLLDACHTGLAGGTALATNDDVAGALISSSGAPLIVLAASKGRQVALEDGRKGGGIFTSALIDALSTGRSRADMDSNGAIDLGELYADVKAKVRSETSGKQSPWLVRNLLVGDMTLF